MQQYFNEMPETSSQKMEQAEEQDIGTDNTPLPAGTGIANPGLLSGDKLRALLGSITEGGRDSTVVGNENMQLLQKIVELIILLLGKLAGSPSPVGQQLSSGGLSSHTQSLPVNDEYIVPAPASTGEYNLSPEESAEAESEKFETAGGHAEAFIGLNDSQIAKKVSLAEKEIYGNREKLGIDKIIASHSPASGGFTDDLSPEAQSNLDAFKKTQGKDEAVLILQKLGADIKAENKRELDIKIGHSTALRPESKERNYFLETQRMRIFDRFTKTNKRGFRLAGGEVHGDKIKKSRPMLGRESEAVLAKTLTLPEAGASANFDKIVNDLTAIKNAATDAPVTFVDSSVLLMVDDQHPENSTAKLIDFSFPYYRGEKDFDKVKHNFLGGMDSLINEVEKLR